MSIPVECNFREMEPLEIWLKGGRHYKGRFTCLRVDRKTLPHGYHAYDLRESDEDDMWFCQLKSFVLVNHAGTFVTNDSIAGANDGIEIEEYSFT